MGTIKLRKYVDSIYVIYTHKTCIFKIFTGIKVDSKFWNIDSPKKNCPNYHGVISQIQSMQQRVINAAVTVQTSGVEPSVERVRREFYNQVTEVTKETPFWDLYKEYLSVRSFKPATQQKAEVYKKTLELYCTWSGYKFHIDSWNRMEFGRYIQYLLFQQKMADSTINRLVRGTKTFLKFAYPDKNLAWMTYKLLAADEEVVALYETELKYLIDADLGGYMEKARDLFIFLATTGMRFSDSQLFQPYWVTDKDVLNFSQHKTGGLAMPPLYEASRRVLMKWGGVPPQITNQKFNEHIKEVFEELKLNRPIVTKVIKNKVVYSSVTPLSEIISSHTARRTFITMCLTKGMPIQDVMKMSGHSDYKSMKPYIRFTQDHIKKVSKKWKI